MSIYEGTCARDSLANSIWMRDRPSSIHLPAAKVPRTHTSCVVWKQKVRLLPSRCYMAGRLTSGVVDKTNVGAAVSAGQAPIEKLSF